MPDHPNDAIRTMVHGMWAGVAPQWATHADHVDARVRPQTERLLVAAEIRPRARVLELACGPGGTGLAAAELVGPEGEVVLSDVAEPMVAVAAERAAARGLRNVVTEVRDLEAIDEPDTSFDAVLCREGLMFAMDPDRAAAEVFRVLRAGGKAALSVWAEPERNPWLGEVLAGASAELGTPMPPPGVPGPFSLADADLAALLRGAGFVDVGVEDVPVPHRMPTFEAYWDLTTDLAGPLASVLAGLDDGTRDAIAARVRTALEPYANDTGMDIPGVSRMVSGRRP